MMNEIIHGDCLSHLELCHCIFADPPDNIGLDYYGYNDNVESYGELMRCWLHAFCRCAPTVWISFNAKHLPLMALLSTEIKTHELKPCVQVYTFYQHNKHDFGNAYRPLWRFKNPRTPVYTDSIRVRSWRQENGDPRASSIGKVPGDVFDFPRVVGNSKQRRSWHPTQLNEGLVARCILSCTLPSHYVIDPFGGTGTVLRVCKELNRRCRTIEISEHYVDKLLEEHPDCRRSS